MTLRISQESAHSLCKTKLCALFLIKNFNFPFLFHVFNKLIITGTVILTSTNLNNKTAFDFACGFL
jgi:hypothetical protein